MDHTLQITDLQRAKAYLLDGVVAHLAPSVSTAQEELQPAGDWDLGRGEGCCCSWPCSAVLAVLALQPAFLSHPASFSGAPPLSCGR